MFKLFKYLQANTAGPTTNSVKKGMSIRNRWLYATANSLFMHINRL